MPPLHDFISFHACLGEFIWRIPSPYSRFYACRFWESLIACRFLALGEFNENAHFINVVRMFVQQFYSKVFAVEDKIQE